MQTRKDTTWLSFNVKIFSFASRRAFETSYVGELAHCIGFDGDVVLLELLLDLVDACGDVLGLRA